MKLEIETPIPSPTQIMVVEDEAIVAMEIKTRLTSLGYSVCATAASGQTALQKALETRPDLILMDIRLKGDMDGIETAHQIRTHLDIPIIYLTAHSDEHTLQRAKVSEPFGYILKPFEERDLHTTIEMALYRYKLERKLKESERWLSTTLNSIGEGVIATDSQGSITFMNPVAEALTGWGQADAMGRDMAEVFQIVNEATRAQAENPVAQVLQKGTTVGPAHHMLLLNRDGQEMAIEDTAAPIQDEQGHISGVVLVFRDVTERKQVEAAMQKAKEAAEAASRAKSEFLANMSHELRTPLNGILGMTELLLDTPLTVEQKDYVETARSSGDTLLTLIDDVLSFSKIEAGKFELENHPFNLRGCIEEVLDLLVPKAAEKQLDLTYLIEDSTPEILVGDAVRLRQILMNLLSNAVKFTEVGEVNINVTARQVLSEEGERGDVSSGPDYEVQFAVTDTGIGIPPDQRDRLFQSFSQVDASMTRRYGGAGLGLAISRSLSELMGGAIWMESDGVTGRGSTFHFTIRARAIPDQTGVSPQGFQPPLTGKRLLIVDDHPTNRYCLTQQTQAWGMLPHATHSAAEALQWMGQGDPFDVVILDTHMPEMEGLKLAGEIRRGYSRTLPTIMLSSPGAGREVTSFNGSEGVTILSKPIKYSQLHNVLVGVFAEQPCPGQADKGRHTDPVPLALRHPLRILLAEDDLVNQKVATLFLQTLGYQPDIATNGLEVLERLTQQAYDVVLMDIQMPEMDGLETTARIYQRHLPEQRPRIVALTANAIEGDREKYLTAGMDDYLSKPIKIKDLVQTLERCQPPLNP